VNPAAKLIAAAEPHKPFLLLQDAAKPEFLHPF